VRGSLTADQQAADGEIFNCIMGTTQCVGGEDTLMAKLALTSPPLDLLGFVSAVISTVVPVEAQPNLRSNFKLLLCHVRENIVSIAETSAKSPTTQFITF